VLGGSSGRKYCDLELRELHIGSDWTWKRVLSGGKAPPKGMYHTATPIADDRLLTFGGNDDDTAFGLVHVLDLASMTWHQPAVTGEPPPARTGHVATCLDGYRVLIHGGWDPSGGTTDSTAFHSDVAILHTEGWHWTRPVVCGTPPVGRAGHSLVALSAPPADHSPNEDDADHDDADDERHGHGGVSGGAGEVGQEPGRHRQLGTSLLLFGGRAAGDKPLDDLYELRPICK